MQALTSGNLILRFLLELRLVIELVIFAVGVAALLLRKRILLGVLLAVAYVVNKILMTVWDQ